MTKLQRQAKLKLAKARLNEGKSAEALEALLTDGVNPPVEMLVACGEQLLARVYDNCTDPGVLEAALKAFAAAQVSSKRFLAIGKELLVWYANLDGGLRAYQAAGVEPPPDQLRRCARQLLIWQQLDQARAAYRAARLQVPAIDLLEAAEVSFRLGRCDTAVEYCRAALVVKTVSGSRLSKAKLVRCQYCIRRCKSQLEPAEHRQLSRLVAALERAGS